MIETKRKSEIASESAPKMKKPKPNNNSEKSNPVNAQKPTFKKPKTFANKTNKPVLDKPPNWNDFKKQKKELRIKRKQSKSLYEVSVQAKQIAEKLRRKNLEGGKPERDKLVRELHGLLGGKGNYVRLVMSHDMGRVVQYLLKFGKQDIREDIAKELIPSTVLLIQSVYGKFCIKSLLKYGNSQIRSDVIKAFYGNVVKLVSHSVSAHVFEFAYSTYAHPKEKQNLIQEFFGDMYKQSKDDKIKHLREVYANSPDLKKAALEATKANLQRILNKKLLDSGLVQSVLFQYLSECSEPDRAEMLSLLAPHAVVLSNSKDGARVVMICIWNGTNKDRKVAMKSLKEHIIDVCKHEYGHTAIIALLDSVDDTVLLNKTILTEILNNVIDLGKNEWGRKVLLWLVAPGNSEHFHPSFVKELLVGFENSTCKKSPEIRRKEIFDYSNNILMLSIEAETKTWFENAGIAIAAVTIIKTGATEQVKPIFRNISKVIVDPEWKITENGETVLGIEHGGLHRSLKKLIQNDKNLIEEDDVRFSDNLFKLLTDETLEVWTKSNRGCFTLVGILENGSESVQNELKNRLKPYEKMLKEQKHAGATVLLKKTK